MTATGPGGGGSEPIRVFLLDDHEIVRRGIRDVLENDGDIVVVGESGDADEGIRLIGELRPTVAVLDVRLGQGSGIDVCREIRAADPSLPVLMLTAYDDDEALVAAVLAGAAGYTLKRIRGVQLLEMVRRLATGETVLDPAVVARVLERVRRQQQSDRQREQLTTQESSILDLIAEGLTNREIAARMSLAEKTVKNYVSSLLAKLGLTSRTQAAIFVTRREPGQA